MCVCECVCERETERDVLLLERVIEVVYNKTHLDSIELHVLYLKCCTSIALHTSCSGRYDAQCPNHDR